MTKNQGGEFDSALSHPASEGALRRVLTALGPYRKDLILIGGWVPYLYQRFGKFPEWKTGIARTIELDLAVPPNLSPADRPPLATILSTAGFSPVPANSGAIWIRDDADDEMIEFFTAHQGTARQIGKARSITGQSDLAAISLTHLSLLTEETRTLEIGASSDGATLFVRVPSLGGYVLNKAVTFTDRLSTSDGGVLKAGKDIGYLRNVMAGGEKVRDQVRTDIAQLAKRSISPMNLVATAEDRVRRLTNDPGGALDAAVSQLQEQHRWPSESAAKADLLGYIEILADLLHEIQRTRQPRGRRSK